MAMRISRRTFVRGAGTVAIGLPLLDAMLDDGGTALADGTPLPQRYVITFGGFSLGCDADRNSAGFIPTATGPGYDLPVGLAPLAGHGDVRRSITVVSGLEIPAQARKDPTEPIPPGGATAIFHFHGNPLLTGNRSEPWVTGDITNGTVTGPSSDVVARSHLGGTGRSLAYRAQARYYQTGTPDGQDILSYETDASGNARAIQPEFSPRRAYDNLFLGFTPDDPAVAQAQARELRRRTSVLDHVDRRIGGLLPRLGSADRHRVQQHYDELRALEMRLSAIAPPMVGACMLPPDPGADSPIGGDHRSPFGGGYVTSAGYSDEDTRARVFCDLIHMALVCDLVRSASLMFTMFQSYMNARPLFGHTETLHGINHAGHYDQLEDVIAWHVDHYGYLVAKLRDTPEGTGSLLDNCAVLFQPEGGFGFVPETGVPYGSHSTYGMASLIAGGAGGLRQGEHVVASAAARHPANVMISLLAALGTPVTTLGEVSGVMPELFV